MSEMILVRGGGDLASGAILRLARAGLRVIVAEVAQPLAVRRRVAFAQAVYAGEVEVEGLIGRRVATPAEAAALAAEGVIPVLVDPDAACRSELRPAVIVDARMTKRPPELGMDAAELVIGLGPGFIAGWNCHAVVETVRGPFLGRVIWDGAAAADTGLPDVVASHQADRVLRAPVDGRFTAVAAIGDLLEPGQVLAEVGGQPIRAPFRGVVRGLLQSGLTVQRGLKVGDLDPRADPRLSRLVSEKALAVGGGVLEAVLTRPALRRRLWDP